MAIKTSTQLTFIIIMFYYANMAATHIHEYKNTSTKSKKLEKIKTVKKN